MNLKTLAVVSSVVFAFSCAHSASGPATPLPDYAGLVAAADRTDADKAMDQGRNPVGLLTFLQVRPGMKVGELISGGGYTTELLARAVGPEGKVYGENTKFVVERFAAKPWAERLERPVNKNVVRSDRELEAPFPDDVHDLDLVVIYANYHDAVGFFKTDRTKMNAAVLAALKPGGHYAIIDSSAKAGTGAADVDSLHRIDEAFVKSEVEAAGFKLERSDDFMRNPADTRDWNASPRAAGDKRGTSDRFALMFVKP